MPFFSMDKVRLIEDIFTDYSNEAEKAESLLAVIVNKGGTLYELRFDDNRIFEVPAKPAGRGVSIFTFYNTCDVKIPQMAFWLQYHKGYVFATTMIFRAPLSYTPFIDHFSERFTLNLLNFVEESTNVKCPLCGSLECAPTEILVKQKDRITQISKRDEIYAGKLDCFEKETRPGVAICFAGACGHNWYRVIKFDTDNSCLYRHDFPFEPSREEDFEPYVIWEGDG